jgi:hypothetical protein
VYGVSPSFDLLHEEVSGEVEVYGEAVVCGSLPL